MLDGPTVVYQWRKSPRRGVYVERQSSSRREAVSQIPHKTGMNGESSLPRLCIYRWDQFEVEGHAAGSLDRYSNRKSYRKLICQIADGLASGSGH
jgi:hypothetical protein